MKSAKILAILLVAVISVSLLATVEKPDDAPKGKGWDQVWDALVDLKAQIVQEIADRIADVDAEEAARIAADNALQNDLDEETAARIAGDDSLQAAIDAEEAARIAEDTALQEQIDAIQLLPAGVIVMWSGSIGDIPDGWALCDGTDETPDLTDRFIVGAGDSYAVDATGGENAHTLSASEMPRHMHSYSGSTSADGAHSHTVPSGGGSSGPRHALSIDTHHTSSTVTSPVGNHRHSYSGDTNYQGGDAAHENRPPYYALAYIMKVQ